MNGFRKTGVYRLNCNVFRTHDFAIHVEGEGVDCEQGAHKPTLSRNRQQASAKKRAY
jgi:hypothetical protein